MSPHITWSRRTFLSNTGLTAAATLTRSLSVAQSPLTAETVKPAPYLAFVSFAGSSARDAERIEIYRVEDGTWRMLGRPVACEAPRALVMHPQRSNLYVAHNTDQHLGLPRGSVSAFSVDAVSGVLSPMGRQPLPLSATYPEHLTISLDGRHLLASAAGGGSYVVLPLAPNGNMVPQIYALKQTGCGPHPSQATSRPHSALFHPSGRFAYASDLGADVLNQILLHDEEMPNIASRRSLGPGSGPGSIALHPSAKILAAANVLSPALTVVELDDLGRFGSITQQLPLPLAASAGPVAFHPSGEFLYAAMTTPSGESQVSVFQTDSHSFLLKKIAIFSGEGLGRPKHMLVLRNQPLLVGEKGIATLPDPRDGPCLPGEAVIVLRAEGIAGVALHPL